MGKRTGSDGVLPETFKNWLHGEQKVKKATSTGGLFHEFFVVPEKGLFKALQGEEKRGKEHRNLLQLLGFRLQGAEKRDIARKHFKALF